MKIDIDNIFAVAISGADDENITIGNIAKRPAVMTVESAANLAAWLLVKSGATQAEFDQAVQAIKALPAVPA
jgi:hypothetical protein